jgi:hypothetical protein
MPTKEEREIAAIKKENEDNKTYKLRKFSLKLTDIQVVKLNNISNDFGRMEPSKVLENFIADLVDYHRNGSDEMQLANAWFERAIAEKRRY